MRDRPSGDRASFRTTDFLVTNCLTTNFLIANLDVGALFGVTSQVPAWLEIRMGE